MQLFHLYLKKIYLIKLLTRKEGLALNADFLTQERFYIQKYILEEDDGWIVQEINKYQLYGVVDVVSAYITKKK